MVVSQPRFGYTLPVFACAAAIAALRYLHGDEARTSVLVDLIEPPQTVEIEVDRVAGLKAGMALAQTSSEPGDNLDLTRNTPIWALVEARQEASEESESITLEGGEGIGRHGDGGRAAIYTYAQKLLRENLGRLLEPREKIQVTIILPEGRQLAQRTSNAAFGIVDGLSLLGTSGISQPLSTLGQLEASLEELRQKADKLGQRQESTLVFCVGENGLDLTRKMGIAPAMQIKTANWLGPLLVEAGIQQVGAILLFGYHGKLIKLAGGIFHTHHHLADGRLEILTAHCARSGLPTSHLQKVFDSATAEAALKYLRSIDASTGSNWVEQVYARVAEAIDRRTHAYIRTHSERDVRVGSVLFDRNRQIIMTSKIGASLLPLVMLNL